MPDGINISINAIDNTAAGIASATSNLQKLQTTANGLGSATANASAIMNGWTKSQWAAAQAGDALTTKALQLGQAVNSGTMTISQATTAYKAFEAQQKANVWQAMTLGEKYRIVSTNVNDAAKSASMAVVKFGAVAAGIGYATKQVYDFAKSGAEIDYTRQKFDRLAVSVGTTGDVFINQLRAATKGTVSDFALFKQGSDLLQLGLAADSAEAVRLSKVMTALGMDTGQLTLALANQSKRRLDQLGLSLIKFNEIEDKLKAKGLTGPELFKEAFLATAEQTVLKTGNRADTAMGDYLRMQAAGANLLEGAKTQVGAKGFIPETVRDIGNVLQGMAAVQRGDMQWTGNLFDLLTTNGPVLRQTNASDLSSLWANGGRTGGNMQQEQAITGLSALQNYTAMAYAYRNAGAKGQNIQTAGGAEITPPDYKSLLDGGLKLTKMTEDYTAKSNDLNAALNEETMKLLDLEKKYSSQSEAVLNQTAKVSDLKSKVTDLNKSYADAMDNMMLGAVNAKDETGKLGLEYARASGQISQDSYEIQTGIEKIAEALNNGKIKASDAASAMKGIGGWAQGMDEKHFNMYIDVWIQTHGSVDIGNGVKVSTKQIAGGTCFIAGTPVTLADGSTKPIEAIQPGDMVLSWDTRRGEQIAAKVAQVFHHPPAEMSNDWYLVVNGIGVTGNHRVFVNGVWRKAETLKIGDELQDAYGMPVTVTSIKRKYRHVWTYNFETDHETHDYFAGGVLVHNAKTEGWTGGPLASFAQGGELGAYNGFVVVGDNPGGGWNATTEVIDLKNMFVYNARDSRMLRDLGILGNARSHAVTGALEWSGNIGSSGGLFSSAKSRPTVSGRQGSPSANVAGVTGSITSSIAAEVAAEVAPQVQGAFVGQQQQTQMHAAQVGAAAQQQSTDTLAGELRELQRLIKKQATRDELYAIYKVSGQQSI